MLSRVLLNSRSRLLLSAGLGVYSIAVASPGPQVRISDSPHPRVSVASPSGASASTFARWLPEDVDSRSAFVVISNASDETIIGISTHWAFIGADGVEKGRRGRCENIFGPQDPVLMPHSSVLVGPDSCVREADSLRAGGTIASSPQRGLPTPAGASEVRIRVDGILFSNGDMYGADGPSYAEYLNARGEAARLLATDARRLLADGHGRAAVVGRLQGIVAHLPANEAIWYRGHLATLGRFADSNPDLFDGILKHIDDFKLPFPIVVKTNERDAKP